MGGSPRDNRNVGNEFLMNLFGGACIWRADPPNDFLFIGRHLVELYDCSDEDEFVEFTGGTFSGAIGEDYQHIRREIDLQLNESPSRSGYVFFNIITKKEKVKRIVCHWALVEDPDEGIVFYANLFLHKEELVGSDFDSITGLYGKLRLAKYYSITQDKAELPNAADYALVYLNIVNFRLLNIEKGVAEGDRCLVKISDLLRDVFKNGFIARISDDHFAILDEYDSIIDKVAYTEKSFDHSYGSHFDVKCKFGIYKIDFIAGDTLDSSLNFAKLASDYIKNNDNLNIVEYSSDIAKQMQTRTYVVDNLDEALDSGWIKVYFQPVVRTLTGSLCGMESLVRWIDPVMGFLRPDQFISALEDARLIHKVDSYMVEQVCRILHERQTAGEPIVPVSINFSRIDFILCDMLSIVEKAVKKYEIPRDFLHIEITESMIASDEELMKKIISGFRGAGYEVWMDDFGSGYSSLTLLKDYDFDMLKLDMKFLSDLSEKSRSIVSSTISMAKDIGVMTLAEGVETDEQLGFLSSVGCGMIQGYYYGKPEPVDEVFAHLTGKGIPVESRKWRKFYESAAGEARLSNYPLEIIEFDGDTFHTLFMNNEYREQIGHMDLSLEEIDKKTYDLSSPLYHVYQEVAEKLITTGEEETFFFPVNSSYFCFTGKLIAQNDGHFLFRATITNISNDSQSEDEVDLDGKLRELALLFEEVQLINIKKNTITSILGVNRFIKAETGDEVSLGDENVERIVRDLIHPDDFRRCAAFMRYDTLKKRIQKSEKGYLEDVFRLKQDDGSYMWAEHYMMQIPGTDGTEYLFCVKRFTERNIDRLEEATEFIDRKKFLEDLEALTIEHADVLENILRNSDFKIFWKDEKLKFRGASKAFYEYFSVADEHKVIGKTARQMKWLIGTDELVKIEKDVIKKGTRYFVQYGKVLADGKVRTILTNQIPMYRDGQIVGLIGCFDDLEDVMNKMDGVDRNFKTDLDTGLPNAHAFFDGLIDFAHDYSKESVDYALMSFRNIRTERLISTYSEDFAVSVIRKMGETAKDIIGNEGIVARTKPEILSVLVRTDSEKGLEKIRKKIVKSLEGITEVDNKPVTIRISSFAALRSATENSDEELYEKSLKAVK